MTAATEIDWGNGSSRKLYSDHGRMPVPDVPAAIVATVNEICPRCEKRRLLPELVKVTGGKCYPCWVTTKGEA